MTAETKLAIAALAIGAGTLFYLSHVRKTRAAAIAKAGGTPAVTNPALPEGTALDAYGKLYYTGKIPTKSKGSMSLAPNAIGTVVDQATADAMYAAGKVPAGYAVKGGKLISTTVGDVIAPIMGGPQATMAGTVSAAPSRGGAVTPAQPAVDTAPRLSVASLQAISAKSPFMGAVPSLQSNLDKLSALRPTFAR